MVVRAGTRALPGVVVAPAACAVAAIPANGMDLLHRPCGEWRRVMPGNVPAEARMAYRILMQETCMPQIVQTDKAPAAIGP